MKPSPRTSVLAPLLLLAMTVATLVIPSLGVLAPFIVEDLGLSRAQFGWLITSIAAVTALTAPSTGRLSDALGGRRVILLLSLAIAASASGIALAPTAVLLVVFGMLSGVPNAAGNPATNRIIVDWLPPGRRGTTMGVKQSGVQFGFFATGLSLPALAVAFGWRGALVSLVLFALGFSLLAAWLLPADGPRRPRSTSRARARLPSDVRWLASYAALMGTAGSTITTFLPLYATEAVGLSPSVAGATVSTLGLIGIVSRILFARAAEHLTGVSRLLTRLAWGSALAAVTIGAAASFGAALVWIGAAMAGVTVVAWNALANLAAITAVDARDAGRSSGMVNFGFMAGFTVGPAVFGALVDTAVGYRGAWWLVTGLFVAAAALMHRWTRAAATSEQDALLA